jgi:hypothetical protein
MDYKLLIILALVLVLFYFKKDTFYNIQQEDKDSYDNYYRPTIFTNQTVPAEKNQEVTKTQLASLFKEIMVYANGPPGGANVSVEQKRYDLIFKDVLVCSDKRNQTKYPNPNNYYLNLNVKIDKVYKAELIDVYIPAATDESINIPPNGNRLYFSYIKSVCNCRPRDCSGYPVDCSGYPVDCSGYPVDCSGYHRVRPINPVDCSGYPVDCSGYPVDCSGYPVDCSGYHRARPSNHRSRTVNKVLNKHVDSSDNLCKDCGKRVDGSITIQAGTYLNPETIAKELTRQFTNVLMLAGIKVDNTTGISVIYDKNLNRYIFKDRQTCRPATLILYTKNGYILSPHSKVEYSIAHSLMLFDEYYISGPKYIDSIKGVLVVRNAWPGDYGRYNGRFVPLNSDCLFGNCILSDVVLTHCKLFLSLGKLNGETCNITPDENGTNKNVPPVFCQVPNNTCVSSAAVKTLLNQPHNFSAIQFYNPPISKVNKFEVKWYTDNGELVRILDHCFTIRIHYFQKRIDTTEFSYPIP